MVSFGCAYAQVTVLILQMFFACLCVRTILILGCISQKKNLTTRKNINALHSANTNNHMKLKKVLEHLAAIQKANAERVHLV